MMEWDARDLVAEGTERMDIAFADAPEIVEIDAQLIGRVRGAHEGGLVDTEPLAEAADVRQGRIADPDDADNLAFDQSSRNKRPEKLRKRARADRKSGVWGKSGAAEEKAGGWRYKKKKK